MRDRAAATGPEAVANQSLLGDRPSMVSAAKVGGFCNLASALQLPATTAWAPEGGLLTCLPYVM